MEPKKAEKTEELKKRIGENIRRIRQQQEITVKQVCNDLEISAAAYSNIERGVTDISVSRIVELSEYFSVHFSQILSVDNTTIYQFAEINNVTASSNQQITTLNADGFEQALQQAKEENKNLWEQNNLLISQLIHKKQ